jgi:uncharacterized protein
VDSAFEQILVSIALTVVAAAYAAVGQGGATGYIAVLGLVGLGPDIIRPAALTLNVLVSAIGTAQFARVGLINWRSFYPFALLGVPCSIVGGSTHLPAFIYHPVVGALLLLAAWQMVQSVRRTGGDDSEAPKQPPLAHSILAGAGIGFIAGVTGIGGGILLAPLMLTLNWAGTRQTSAVSAAFNLLNTVAALAGLWLSVHAFALPPSWWLLAVVCGGSFRLVARHSRFALVGHTIRPRYAPNCGWRTHGYDPVAIVPVSSDVLSSNCNRLCLFSSFWASVDYVQN